MARKAARRHRGRRQVDPQRDTGSAEGGGVLHCHVRRRREFSRLGESRQCVLRGRRHANARHDGTGAVSGAVASGPRHSHRHHHGPPGRDNERARARSGNHLLSHQAVRTGRASRVCRRSAREVAAAARYTKVLGDYPARPVAGCHCAVTSVPRHNGAPIGMRLTLHHDFHGLATWSRDFLLSPSSSEGSPERGEALLSGPDSSGRSPRMKADLSVARLRFDRFELDEAEARLTCAGEPVALAPNPSQCFARSRAPRGMPVTKNALLDASGAIGSSPSRCSVGDQRGTVRRSATTRSSRATSRPYRGAAIASSLPRLARLATRGCRRAQRRGGADHPPLTALTALCRGDAALAELIRTRRCHAGARAACPQPS